jgi:hypothetical protein
VTGWYAKPLADVPAIAREKHDDPVWYPLQHHLDLTAFGANAYVAPDAGVRLLEAHDETESGQEELYIVVAGAARFTLDEVDVEASAPFVVAVLEPGVTRAAVSVAPGTTVLALGGERRDAFRSSWNERHFEDVPRAGDNTAGPNPRD